MNEKRLNVTASDVERVYQEVWKQSINEIGLPDGLYDDVGQFLFKFLNNKKLTFQQVDVKPLEQRIRYNYNQYISKNGKFTPKNASKYSQANGAVMLININDKSSDPSQYTKEYIQKINTIYGGNASTTSTNKPSTTTTNVNNTSMGSKPGVVVSAPVFPTYDPNANLTTATTTTTTTAPATTTTTTTAPATTNEQIKTANTVNNTTTNTNTTSVQPPIAKNNVTSYITMILVSIIVSILLIVTVIMFALYVTKPKVVNASVF
jgi:hypothetical protein